MRFTCSSLNEAVAHDRSRRLVETGIALSSELSLETLLKKLIETAVELTDARYGALGVIDRAGTALEQFITVGVDDELRQTIGELPHGRGILGALIRDKQTLRLPDLSQDPRSVGFPPGHPPMSSFLGVPIMLRGTAYGNLYLTEKANGADFTEADQELVTLLASQAAVAVENARLYESATRWSRQLESLHEVARTFAEETELERLLEQVCRHLRELIGARLALILLPNSADGLRIAAADAADKDAASLVGDVLKRTGSKAGRVLDRRQPARVDSVIDDPEVDQEEARRLGIRSGIYVPLVSRGRAIGVVAVHDKLAREGRFGDADLRLAEIFGARVAVAVDNSERVARDTLRRVLDAQELERRRLALELHDETGQALTSILLGLKAIRAAPDAAAAERAEADLRELVVGALQNVRGLAVELRPASLDDFGLGSALERLATTLQERSGLEVAVEVGLDERLDDAAETAIYRFVQEAFTNVVKHARASRVSVVVGRRDGGVSAVVEDDGRGFDQREIRPDALGLVGMRERLALLGGTLAIESRPGHGTSLIAFVP